MSVIPFQPFPKIPRLKRDSVITEKIDGTNASVLVTEDGDVFAGSRTRWITPDDDNFGFAAHVEANRDTFLALGPGHHFGEWWGSGIQRNYGLPPGERRFSLFNTSRWAKNPVPDGLHVVPILHHGPFSSTIVEDVVESLRTNGSVVVPGFLNPEGIVVYLPAANQMFKVTVYGDEKPKGQEAA